MALGFGTNSAVTNLVPDLNYTVCKRLIATTGTALGQVGTFILAAHLIGFPVPLLLQFGAIPSGFFGVLMPRLVIGSGAPESGFRILKKYRRYYQAFMTFIGIFPLCKVLYDFVPVSYRYVVIIVLPLWKFAAKHFIVYATRGLEDIIPESVAFFADFFSSLFVSVCMSSSGPLYLSFLFIIVDLVQLLLETRELKDNANMLLQLIQQQSIDRQNCTPDMLETILNVVRESGAFQSKSLESVRLRASVPHFLTSKQAQELLNLEASGTYCSQSRSSGDTIKRLLRPNKFKQSTSIVPTPSPEPAPRTQYAQTAPTNNSSLVTEKSEKLILQGLQLLFHCEYLEMVEYVECVIPIVFVVYKSILEQLPNIVYYPGGPGNWGIGSAGNILVLAMLEVLSLVILHRYLQRKFAFSALHQLAFTLETHVHLVQLKLLTGIFLLVPLELQHFGADFTLRFEWLNDK
ncbi:hypothetical protein F441_15264 [Phytophthora nicotianae CJ01A1]|uniref:Uncharacterized protein n=3 Tax=Phytophthora nicotianae TaxID=4792 RepID=V9EIY9_PHYNI|nr:hypothetical protein F443_15442 [Phytophthora nicotianae P1569]ETO67657.1 hypothetical protein F444_15442 [Phytophthora nicotianae P1976]ETP08819.1 hypothetical protein F441_15264 [Phytophthora nicotianae CJ01A1]